jgi:hypothetical protein
MLSSGFQHSVRQRALWIIDQCWNHMFQRSQILNELIPPAYTKSSVTSSSRSAPARNSVVNLLYRLVDHLFRGFHSVDDQFRAKRLKWLKLFSLCFSASGARSWSISNPAFYTVFLSFTWFQWISRIWYFKNFCSSLLGHLQTLL